MKRYSFGTVQEAVKINRYTAYNRAKRLGIDVKKGVTAEDVKAILQYKRQPYRRGGTAEELLRELGVKK